MQRDNDKKMAALLADEPVVLQLPLHIDNEDGVCSLRLPTGVRVPLTHVVGAAAFPTGGGRACIHAFEYPPPRHSGCGRGSNRHAPGERSRVVHEVAASLSLEEATSWADRITRAAQGVGASDDSPPTSRELLVFINPKSGPGKGVALFKSLCEQMLLDARCGLTVVVTTRPAESSERLRDMPTAALLRFDGVLAAGGDGTMHEVLQGLLSRADADAVRRVVKLGVLPVGSGNGAAASFCSAAGLPYSVSNSCIMIAQRWTSVMDAASTFVLGGGGGSSSNGASTIAASSLSRHLYAGLPPGAWGERRYSFLATAYGIVADLDIESEVLRCLGAMRFDVFGLVRTLFLRRYRGKLSWLPGATGGAAAALPLAAAVTVAVPAASAAAGGVGGDWNTNTSLSIGSPKGTPAAIAAAAATAAACVPVSHLVPFDEPVPASWTTVSGPFTLLWICLTSHQSIGVAAAPRGTHDDGMYSVVLVRDVSRVKMMNILLGLDNSGSFTSVPGVEAFTASAFRLEPDMGDSATALGHLCVDGESMPVGPIQSEVLPGYLNVYGPRGAAGEARALISHRTP